MPKARASAAVVTDGLVPGGLNVFVADDSGILVEDGWNADGVITGLTDEQVSSLASASYSGGPAFAKVASGSGSVMRDSPLAYYRLNDASGPALDVAGHPFWGPGQLAPPGTYPAGAVRNSLTLMGSEDAVAGVQIGAASTTGITFGDNFGFAGTASFSIDMWYRPSQVGTAAALASKRDSGLFQGWFLTQSSGGTLQFVRYGGGTSSSGTTSTTVVANTVYHIAATYDGVANTSRIYVNGLLDKTTVHTSTPSIDVTTNPFVIAGATTGTTAVNVSSRFSDVAVYDSALSAERVWAHYIAGKYGSL